MRSVCERRCSRERTKGGGGEARFENRTTCLVAAHGLEVVFERPRQPLGPEEEEQPQELHALEHEENYEAHLFVGILGSVCRLFGCGG